jgi:hypothetical protein
MNKNVVEGREFRTLQELAEVFGGGELHPRNRLENKDVSGGTGHSRTLDVERNILETWNKLQNLEHGGHGLWIDQLQFRQTGDGK